MTRVATLLGTGRYRFVSLNLGPTLLGSKRYQHVNTISYLEEFEPTLLCSPQYSVCQTTVARSGRYADKLNELAAAMGIDAAHLVQGTHYVEIAVVQVHMYVLL